MPFWTTRRVKILPISTLKTRRNLNQERAQNCYRNVAQGEYCIALPSRCIPLRPSNVHRTRHRRRRLVGSQGRHSRHYRTLICVPRGIAMCCVVFQRQEEGRTALSLALMEQREDIADLIISVDDTDVNAPDKIVSPVTTPHHAYWHQLYCPWFSSLELSIVVLHPSTLAAAGASAPSLYTVYTVKKSL